MIKTINRLLLRRLYISIVIVIYLPIHTQSPQLISLNTGLYPNHMLSIYSINLADALIQSVIFFVDCVNKLSKSNGVSLPPQAKPCRT